MIGKIFIYNKHFPFAYEKSPCMKTMGWEELLISPFKPIHWTWDERIVTILPQMGKMSVYKTKWMLSLDQNSSQSMFRQETLPGPKCAQYGSLYTPEIPVCLCGKFSILFVPIDRGNMHQCDGIMVYSKWLGIWMWYCCATSWLMLEFQ